MPRRYQPPVKRRKAKKTRLKDIIAQPLEPGDGGSAVAAPAPPPPLRAPAPSADEGGHVARDYSYVLGELRRIALIGGLIVVSLVLTAVFLR